MSNDIRNSLSEKELEKINGGSTEVVEAKGEHRGYPLNKVSPGTQNPVVTYVDRDRDEIDRTEFFDHEGPH